MGKHYWKKRLGKKDLNYINIYLSAYGALGAFLPLIGQYLKLLGFTGVQIGTVTAAGTATAIIASTFLGGLYSKSASKKRFVLKLILAVVLFCLSLYFVHIYALFLVLFCALNFFQAPTIALVDAMAVEDGREFGETRKWGAVGFALGAFVAGKISETVGLQVIFFIYAGCFAVLAWTMYAMSAENQDKGKAVAEKSEKPFKAVLCGNKKYVKLVICAFFINGTVAGHNTYFGFLFVQGGGSIAGIGLVLLLMAGSEAPFMAWADKFAKVFTLEKALLAAMCVSAARFAWYSSCPSATLLLGLFVLQGMSTGVIIVEFVKYVAKIVDSEEVGIAIAVYYAFGSNLSAIFCQFTGGAILDRFGAGGVYAFFACLNFVGVAVYAAGKLYEPAVRIEGRGEGSTD